MNEQYLARLNGVGDPSRLRAGQRLFIPGASRTLNLSGQTRTKNPPATTSEKKTSPLVTAKALPPKKAQSTKGTFSWPLQGALLQNFGLHGNRNCNGIEIAASEDTPILAAGDGQVTYSGDGISGYGNLIILKHADSFFTIYGFNRKNLVAAGTRVKRGEKIALSGRPPFAGPPRLHFEIRQGKAAVNPIFYLP